MKKILWGVLIVLALFGYMSYSWMQTQGWTVFSKGDNELQATSTEVLISKQTDVPLLFVGDIMLGRYVETLTKKSGDELYAFKEMKEYLKQHITIANLEGPIPDIHKPTPINGFSFSFPLSSPRILKEGGITAVTLANNHMFDQGRSGYEATKFALDAGGVSHFGGYSPTEDDYFETKLGDTPVIVYGITMIATGWDEAQAIEVTQKLRSEHKNAHLIAFLHWGDEYTTQNVYQKVFAHTLIDTGVDTIIGSHSHVVQGIEIYKKKPIFYSLGNFIFDQYWQNNLEDGLVVKLSKEGSSYIYELVPIHSTRSVPSIATPTKRDQILVSIAKQSSTDLQPLILKGKMQINK